MRKKQANLWKHENIHENLGVSKGTGSALKEILRGYVRDTVINNDDVWAQAKRTKASTRERWEQAT